MSWRKITVIVAVAAFCVLASTAIVHPKELKIGYIDSGRILAGSKAYAEAQKTLEELKAEWQKQAAAKEEEIKKLQDELDRQRLLLSPDTERKKQEEIRAKYEEYRKFVDSILSPETGKLAQKTQELSKPIYDKINAILERIGEEEDYDIIFDAFPQTIVFAKPEYDLTEKVLEMLNKEGK